jgi:hypothetical protein
MPHRDVSMNSLQKVVRSIASGLLLLAVASGVITTGVSAAEAQRADSRHVKALFVLNFLGFTEWPASKQSSAPGKFVIAVLGDPEFAGLVTEAAAGRVVSGRSVIVRSVDAPESALDAHVVFIAGSQARRLPAVLRTITGAGVLTVGDTEGFARDGVAINLYELDNRVRIEVNSTAAARAGLRLNANLMRLARLVE